MDNKALANVVKVKSATNTSRDNVMDKTTY